MAKFFDRQLSLLASPGRSRIAHAPLAFLAFGLVLSSIPLWGQAPGWTAFLLLASVAVRLLLNWRKLPLLPMSARLLLLGAATAAVVMEYGTFLGVEPGFGILLILLALKILETNSTRDIGVLTVLGYFLALCSLFFSQDLSRWLYVGLIVAVLSAANIYLQEGRAPGAFWHSSYLAGRLCLQAVPLVAIFFLFCPRPHVNFRLMVGSSMEGGSGMSERLQPGSIASLALRQDRAFRVAFPDGVVPPAQNLYWRGLVLWRGNGLVWDRGPIYPRLPLESAASASIHGLAIRQTIMLDPHGMNWLYSLDRPLLQPRNIEYWAGGELRTHRPVTRAMIYEVQSQPQNREATLRPAQLQAALGLPEHVSPAVRALADSFRNGAANNHEIAERALEYFRTHGFSYSLEPGAYTSPELDEFLFQRRVGFCEHYAAAFSTLMRLAGVPSRVICGYLGGTDIGSKTILVRQSEAHAWCEIWVPGSGWYRVDPTNATAPDRINLGLRNYLPDQRPSGGLTDGVPGGHYWSSLRQKATLAWDNVSFQWDLRVLTYNDEVQSQLLASLGLGTLSWLQLTGHVVMATLFLLGLLALWLGRSVRAVGDPAGETFAEFCRASARAGLRRTAGEGPLDFTRRMAERFAGNDARAIREVGTVFAAIRYARTAPPVSELRRAVHAVGRLRQGPHEGEA